jgi:trehalose synthase
MEDNAEELLPLLERDDIVALHDPQTAGMAPILARRCDTVLWRCHVGADAANEELARGWEFLRPYLAPVKAAIFSRARYAPDFLRPLTTEIPPSVDVFSPKNEDMSEARVRAILGHTGLVDTWGPEADRTFLRTDGAPGRVDRRADLVRHGRAPRWETPLVVQVSRWDPLKDPLGVLQGFDRLLRQGIFPEPELVLAGPAVHAVADDPEAAATFDHVVRAWRKLKPAVRSKIHLASLPLNDPEENAAIVNALQRHATVIVQKSLEEGFGLTVTEAMWKARPVVASAVGGIQDQLVDGVHGLLLRDPRDLGAFAAAVRRMLEDPAFAAGCGARARARVIERYLAARQLQDYTQLLDRLEPGLGPHPGPDSLGV